MSTTKITVLEKPFILRPYSKGELVQLFGISRYILNKWLDDIKGLGKPVGKLYSVKQVQMIVDAYGVPGQIINEAA